MKSVHICVFGASITWGAYDAEKGGWAERLKIYFFSQENNKYAEIYNLGVSDATTDDLLKRFDIECEARRMNVAIFSIGNNDSQCVKSLNSNRTSIDEFRKNLEKLCEKALKFTDKIIFAGLTGVDETKTQPIYWNTDISYSNENIGKYDMEIEKFCQEKKLKYINLKGILEDGDWEDGLHPNAKGHEKIFEKIKPEVLSIFQEAKD
jgi:lysophospholipase L1-like esterase